MERCAEYTRLPREQVQQQLHEADGLLLDEDGAATGTGGAGALGPMNKVIPVAATHSAEGAAAEQADSPSRTGPNGTSNIKVAGGRSRGSSSGTADGGSMEDGDGESTDGTSSSSARRRRVSSSGETVSHPGPAVAIDVKNLSLRYRLHKNPVLRGVSFQVQKGEKIGVVGRTGSGKSSLYNALSGLYPAQSGSHIFMLGEELEKCEPVYWRRAKFRMVSQDSALMSGTIRENLSGEVGRGTLIALGASSHHGASEAKIMWQVLETVGLKDTVKNFEKGLGQEIDSSGDSFSVGEKQLFAVARALMDDPQILLCDEATANIDLYLDERIHNLVLADENMKDVTVFWIMHRLHFVEKFDKVLIFEQGQLVEHGRPRDLQSDPQSRLCTLLQEAALLGEGEATGSGGGH